MAAGAISPHLTHSEIEATLRDAVQRRRAEWTKATEQNRAERRERFIAALQTFNNFVLNGVVPEEFLEASAASSCDHIQ